MELGSLHGRRSLCGALRDRELFGSKIRAHPFLADLQSEECSGGCVLNNPGLVGSPAFACEYSKVYNGGKFLAVADEEGFISIMDTAGPLPRSTADDDEPKPRAQWLAHKNAVFDIAWAKGDSWMLAASGDQTISLWDTGLAEPLDTFRAHTGSVKSICVQPGCNDVFASGARDGVLMVWDARVPAVADVAGGEPYHLPVVTVQDAHAPADQRRRSRRTPLQGRTKPSVTSVLFADGCTLATGGVDGNLKLWDLRLAAAPMAQHAPHAQLAQLCSTPLPSIGLKQHGITSLALHPNGVELLVSLTGGHHMMYQLHRPHIGPTKLFGGHTVASFYVKAAFSPDGSHILSGSTDRKAYIWQVEGGEGCQPYTLSGHEGEVTAVAWCSSDLEQVATTADDATVRVWTLKRQDWGVREVADEPEPKAWQDLQLELPRGLASPSPSPSALSQPTTPQTPSAHRTPGSAGLVAGPSRENVWQGNLLQQAQQQQQRPPRPGGTGLGSPASAQQQQQAAARAEASLGRPASSARRRPQSVAELHQASGSQKPKRKRQQSIAPFLSPPPPPLGSPCAAQPGGGEAGCPGSASRPRRLPVSPRLKRLRVSFELPQQRALEELSRGGGSGDGLVGSSLPAGTAVGHAAAAAGEARLPVAAAASSQLEPSPTAAAAVEPSAVGKHAFVLGTAPAAAAAAADSGQGPSSAACATDAQQQQQQRQPGAVQRRGSLNENATSNL